MAEAPAPADWEASSVRDEGSSTMGNSEVYLAEKEKSRNDDSWTQIDITASEPNRDSQQQQQENQRKPKQQSKQQQEQPEQEQQRSKSPSKWASFRRYLGGSRKEKKDNNKDQKKKPTRSVSARFRRKQAEPAAAATTTAAVSTPNRPPSSQGATPTPNTADTRSTDPNTNTASVPAPSSSAATSVVPPVAMVETSTPTNIQIVGLASVMANHELQQQQEDANPNHPSRADRTNRRMSLEVQGATTADDQELSSKDSRDDSRGMDDTHRDDTNRISDPPTVLGESATSFGPATVVGDPPSFLGDSRADLLQSPRSTTAKLAAPAHGDPPSFLEEEEQKQQANNRSTRRLTATHDEPPPSYSQQQQQQQQQDVSSLPSPRGKLTHNDPPSFLGDDSVTSFDNGSLRGSATETPARLRNKEAERSLREKLDRLSSRKLQAPPFMTESSVASSQRPDDTTPPTQQEQQGDGGNDMRLNERVVEELCLSKDIEMIQAACKQLEMAIVQSLQQQQAQQLQKPGDSPARPGTIQTRAVSKEQEEETYQLLDWEIRLQNRLLALHKKDQKKWQHLKNHQDDSVAQSAAEQIQQHSKQMTLVHCRLASLWAWYNDEEMHQKDKNNNNNNNKDGSSGPTVPNEAHQYRHQQRAQSHIEEALYFSQGDPNEEYRIYRLEARLLQKWQEWQRAIVPLEQAQQCLLNVVSLSSSDDDDNGDSKQDDPKENNKDHDEKEELMLKIHYENCSIVVEIASLHAKVGHVWKAIYLLKDCVKDMMQQHPPPNPAKDYTQYNHEQPSDHVSLLGQVGGGGGGGGAAADAEDIHHQHEVDEIPVKPSSPSTTTEQDRIYATVYGKLGMLLLEVKRPRKAAAFLAMALELTWAVYNRRTKDRKTRQMAEKLSKALCSCIAMMDHDGNNDRDPSPARTQPEPTVAIPKIIEAPSPPVSVKHEPQEKEKEPPSSSSSSKETPIFPFTYPRHNHFTARTWWLVDFDQMEDDVFVEENRLLDGDNVSKYASQGATPLVSRCMQVHEWEEAYARRVLSAYRQFLWLKTEEEDWHDTKVSPCTPVEIMWKEHTTDLKNYYHDSLLLCDGNVVNYNPDERTAEYREKQHERLAWTRKTLSSHFGKLYDSDLWMDDGPLFSFRRRRWSHSAAPTRKKPSQNPNSAPYSSPLRERPETLESIAEESSNKASIAEESSSKS